jgi:hypothetical protein
MLEIPTPTEPHSFDPPPEAAAFYADSLKLLGSWDIPYLLSGTYGLSNLTYGN